MLKMHEKYANIIRIFHASTPLAGQAPFLDITSVVEAVSVVLMRMGFLLVVFIKLFSKSYIRIRKSKSYGKSHCS